MVQEALAALLGAPRLSFAPCTCGPTCVARRVEYAGGSVLLVIDVDGEPELQKRFGYEVPVIEIEGGPTFSLEIDRQALAAALRSAASREVAA
jgi:hypothetical protein